MPLPGYNILTERAASATVGSHGTQMTADFADTHKAAKRQSYGLLARLHWR